MNNIPSIGDIVTHNYIGACEVIEHVKGSRTRVKIECIDRGPGWIKEKQKYIGVRKDGSWSRGENRHFGMVDTVHIKELN